MDPFHWPKVHNNTVFYNLETREFSNTKQQYMIDYIEIVLVRGILKFSCTF